MSEPQPVASRFDRRRAATRAALVAAARQILAESRDTDVSIQKIAERADVGFGSFYNHFASKAELFEAAVTDAMEEYGATIDALTAGIEDPAEVFAASVRLTAALVESSPEVMRILRHHGMGQLRETRGLAPRTLRDLERGTAAGRFKINDPATALYAIGGAQLGLLERHFQEPAIAGPQAAQEIAELLLRMLGVPLDEAAELSRRPLPPIP